MGWNFSSVISLLKSLLFRKIFSVQLLKHTAHINILLEGRKTWYTETYNSCSDKITFNIVTRSICLELDRLHEPKPKYQRSVHAEKHKSQKTKGRKKTTNTFPKQLQSFLFIFDKGNKEVSPENQGKIIIVFFY